MIQEMSGVMRRALLEAVLLDFALVHDSDAVTEEVRLVHEVRRQHLLSMDISISIYIYMSLL